MKDLAVDHLRRALLNENGDLPGVDAMTNCTYSISHSIGTNARWIKGCSCHADILQSAFSQQKKEKLMEDAGELGGYCVWMGRRLVELIHGGRERMIRRVRDAGTERYNTCLLELREHNRSKIIAFEEHVKSRWIDVFTAKSDYIFLVPHLVAGLMGMYFGASLRACGEIAGQLLKSWVNATERNSMHRVGVALFTTDTLMAQLVAMSAEPRGLTHLPDLFFFTIKVALLLLAGQFLEGRHRRIKLQVSGSGTGTHPAFQSFRLRKPENRQNVKGSHLSPQPFFYLFCKSDLSSVCFLMCLFTVSFYERILLNVNMLAFNLFFDSAPVRGNQTYVYADCVCGFWFDMSLQSSCDATPTVFLRLVCSRVVGFVCGVVRREPYLSSPLAHPRHQARGLFLTLQ